MIATGNMYTAGVSYVEHKCDNCNHNECYENHKYPIYINETIGEIIELRDNIGNN